MRVTDNMMSELQRSGVANARRRALEAQRVAQTGKRVEAPSDDPAAAAAARRRLAETERVRAMSRAAEGGVTGLDLVDGVLDSMSDAVAQARQLAVEAANGTLGAGERAQIGEQIAALRASVLGMTSTRVDGRYVLNGMREDATPYDAAGTFVGDRNVREVEVAPGHRVPQSLAIGDVLSPAGGTDVLGALEALRVALATNDVAGIQTGIGAMETSTEQLADARGQVGTLMASMEMAKSLDDRLEQRLVAETSALVDADPFEAFSELQLASQALEQAVTIASRLPLSGLVQAMR